MEIKYIDIHSHLCLADYPVDQKTVIQNMRKNDVGTIIVGSSLEDSIEVVKLAEKNENIWACIGVHPHEESKIGIHHGVLEFEEKEFEKLVSSPKVVAVGECGLDYYKLAGSPEEINKIKAKQKEVFIKQIEFAIKYNKPLMLHIREAFDDAYEILSKYSILNTGYKLRGNVHFFTGKLDTAQKFIDLGFTISFVGLITYVHDFDKIIKALPLTSIQAETDAPFVPPVPHRGEKNEPSYVTFVYQKIAEIRGADPETVRLQLLENAKRVFGI